MARCWIHGNYDGRECPGCSAERYHREKSIESAAAQQAKQACRHAELLERLTEAIEVAGFAAEMAAADPHRGLVTIETTAGGFGTEDSDWFTVITGGTDQRIFLHEGILKASIGDRLRITYDPRVLQQLKGPKGTTGYKRGVIVSMDVISSRFPLTDTTNGKFLAKSPRGRR